MSDSGFCFTNPYRFRSGFSEGPAARPSDPQAVTIPSPNAIPQMRGWENLMAIPRIRQDELWRGSLRGSGDARFTSGGGDARGRGGERPRRRRPKGMICSFIGPGEDLTAF